MNGIYRAPMRARSLDLPPYEGARFGVERGVVGIGEVIEPQPESPEEAAATLARTHNEKAGRMLARFAALPEGTFVWTRTEEDIYRLGRIMGPWRYDNSAGALRVGIPHVRETRWVGRELHLGEIPATVPQTFDRGGRNFQRIHDEEAERGTASLWGEHG